MNLRLAMTFSVILFCAFSLLPNVTQASAEPEQKAEAASLYENGEYKAAYKQYLKLAKDGDTFAQYRVSFMRLTGLGTRENIAEAMAWAVLASQYGGSDMKAYRDTVTTMVPVKKRKSAVSKIKSYVRRWGSVNASMPAGASKKECTGSRLMRNCFAEGSTPPVRIVWSDDRSEDPAQLDRINELNQVIVESFAGPPASSEES